MASRSCILTTPPRPRSRRSCSTASPSTTARRNANVHRGVHYLSEIGTRAYEETRAKAQRWLNAAHSREIVFVRGTTEAINLVAASHGRANVGEGDEIVVSVMEHHSNIVPWQILAEQTGARLRVIPINDDGELLLDEYEELLGPPDQAGLRRPRLQTPWGPSTR